MTLTKNTVKTYSIPLDKFTATTLTSFVESNDITLGCHSAEEVLAQREWRWLEWCKDYNMWMVRNTPSMQELPSKYL